jgi:hypothetical protein
MPAKAQAVLIDDGKAWILLLYSTQPRAETVELWRPG